VDQTVCWLNYVSLGIAIRVAVSESKLSRAQTLPIVYRIGVSNDRVMARIFLCTVTPLDFHLFRNRKGYVTQACAETASYGNVVAQGGASSVRCRC
jgi:hypothetical protein